MKRVLVGAVLATLLMPAAVTMAQEPSTLTPSAEAADLGRAVMGDLAWFQGAEFEAKPSGDSAGLLSGGLGDFEVNGPAAAVLSTGLVSTIDDPNTQGGSGTSLGGPNVRGNTDFDVTVLRIDIDVPADTNCLVGMDFRFYSEEYPEYVGSAYNDAFIAELDESTWTTSGSSIEAPGNFAFDPTGASISINAAGETSMAPENAAGTTFDGATPILTAATPITPGEHSLYLSLFDQGDRILDSAVVVDNLRLGRVADVEADCRPGATVVDRTEYVALGDSYSSGFGVSPYEPGTNEDDGPNNCQRSTRAYSQLVAAAEGLDLTFGACQGGVTTDFLEPRNATWGEPAQVDYLSETTGLVTFSIGGNDAKFADVLAECILGFELLPFNTCYNEDKVTVPVEEAFTRLDNRSSLPDDIVPFTTLYQEIRDRAGVATVVGMGYPHFYPAEGGDRTFLPGGRCEGVKKADQRWMVEKIDELNALTERNLRRAGYLFANPNPRFDGHELCGEDDEWIFPLLSGGRVHPTADGQAAMSEAVLATLADDGFERFTVLPAETVSYSFEVGGPLEFISVVTGWPGSDVELTLVSPSGREISRSSQAEDVTRRTGPTHEQVEVATPEEGTWTARMYGLDVPASGEPVTLSVYQAPVPNQRPVAAVTTQVDGDRLIIDASSSTDPDGEVVSYAWYVADAEDDEVFTGPVLEVPRVSDGPRTITLVVTDDRGLTDFLEVRWLSVDAMPGSDVNPVKLSSAGVTPVVFLGSADLDVTTLDPATITAGPGAARPERNTAMSDVNGDGQPDLQLRFRTRALGLTAQDDQLCVTGDLSDGESFTGCDAVRTQ